MVERKSSCVSSWSSFHSLASLKALLTAIFPVVLHTVTNKTACRTITRASKKYSPTNKFSSQRGLKLKLNSSSLRAFMYGFRNVYMAGFFSPNQRPAHSIFSLDNRFR